MILDMRYPHPGEFMRVLLDEEGHSITDAGKLLGVHRVNLTKVINGKSPLSRDLAYRFEALIGGTDVASILLHDQVDYDLANDAAKRKAIRDDVAARAAKFATTEEEEGGARIVRV